MIEVEKLSKEKVDLSGVLDKYKTLPITNMLDNEFTTEVHSHALKETMIWFAHTYSPTISKILHFFDGAEDTLKQLVIKQDETQEWLKESVERISSKIDEALSLVMDKEMQSKHDFFMKRNQINE